MNMMYLEYFLNTQEVETACYRNKIQILELEKK
jgi:hypothetical protein